MKSIWTLIKLQFRARMSLSRGGGIKSFVKLALIAAALLATFGALVAVYYMLAREFAHDYEPADLTHEFLIFTFAIFFVFQMFFLIPALIKRLDINNDRELLLKLPVSPRQIFISKIIVQYVLEIIFAIFVLLPILIAYGIATDMHGGFYAWLLPILVFAPVVPFFLASMLLYPLMIVSNYIRRRPILTTITYFVLLVGSIIVYMLIIENAMGAILNSQTFRATLTDNASSIHNASRPLLPARLFANLMNTTWYTQIWSAAAILFGSATLIAVSFLVAGKAYKKTYQTEPQGIITTRGKSEFKVRKPWISVAKKDLLNIFRSPNYTFQFLLLVVLTPVVVYFVNRIALVSSFHTMSDAATDMTFGASLLVILILLPLSASFAGSNITREGHTLYQTKLIPYGYRKQIAIKAIIVFIPVFLSMMMSVVLLAIPMELETPNAVLPRVFRLASYDAWFLVYITSMLSVFYVTLGMWMDIRKPMHNHLSEGELQKPTPTINTVMVIGLILAFTLGILTILGSYVDFLVFVPSIHRLAVLGSHMWLVMIILTPILAIISTTLLFTDGAKRYNKISG